MKYLLDTCVLSELWKPTPSSSLMSWLGAADEHELALSVLTLGEIQKGISAMTPGKRARDLSTRFQQLRARFGASTLAVTSEIAVRWGELASRTAKKGRALHPVDGLLAATGLVHELAVVTRNEIDFEATGVRLLNPW